MIWLIQKANCEKGAMNLGESLALKAVSLLLALILWITILGLKHETIEKKVQFQPLVAPGMTIVSKIPEDILFELSGPRVLLKDVERKLQPIRPDLRARRERTHAITIKQDLAGQLPAGVKIVSHSPSKPILIQLEELVERYVPVRAVLTGIGSESVDTRHLVIQPPRVPVSGAKSFLAAIEYVETEPIDIADLKEKGVGAYAVEVDSSQGFRLSRDKVAVRVELKKRRRSRRKR